MTETVEEIVRTTKVTFFDIISKEISREIQEKIIENLQKKEGFSIGAIISFLGVTRETTKNLNKKVVHLEYTAYKPLAMKIMKEIGDDAIQKYPDLSGLAIVHRIGIVKPGQSSILVLTASPRRKDAIHAMDWIMDTVKERVPVFKKEIYLEGDSTWKENEEACCSHSHSHKLKNSLSD